MTDVTVLAFLFLLLKIKDVFSVNTSFHSEVGSDPIANETFGFEKIFVVNAPWRTDRKDAMILAATYSKLKLDWIDGIDGETIQEKAYPPGKHRQLSSGNLGSWRAHIDAMREIVVGNISTALVLEDDVDWDTRIRNQLHSFAYATRMISSLINQPNDNLQPSVPSSETKIMNPVELAKRSSIAFPRTGPHNIPPDPYGRDWDILWLGHCGADLPYPSPTSPNRLMLLNDPTVPPPKHLRLRTSSPPDPVATLYPPHTRVYHRTSNSTLCTLAYAVTQRGARKILYELGIRDLSKGYDFALSDHCAGLIRDFGDGVERRLRCVTVQPPLFSHYWGETGGSDIQGFGGGGRPEVGSRYVVRSVRGNLEGLGEERGTLFEQWSE